MSRSVAGSTRPAPARTRLGWDSSESHRPRPEIGIGAVIELGLAPATSRMRDVGAGPESERSPTGARFGRVRQEPGPVHDHPVDLAGTDHSLRVVERLDDERQAASAGVARRWSMRMAVPTVV